MQRRSSSASRSTSDQPVVNKNLMVDVTSSTETASPVRRSLRLLKKEERARSDTESLDGDYNDRIRDLQSPAKTVRRRKSSCEPRTPTSVKNEISTENLTPRRRNQRKALFMDGMEAIMEENVKGCGTENIATDKVEVENPVSDVPQTDGITPITQKKRKRTTLPAKKRALTETDSEETAISVDAKEGFETCVSDDWVHIENQCHTEVRVTENNDTNLVTQSDCHPANATFTVDEVDDGKILQLSEDLKEDLTKEKDIGEMEDKETVNNSHPHVTGIVSSKELNKPQEKTEIDDTSEIICDINDVIEDDKENNKIHEMKSVLDRNGEEKCESMDTESNATKGDEYAVLTNSVFKEISNIVFDNVNNADNGVEGNKSIDKIRNAIQTDVLPKSPIKQATDEMDEPEGKENMITCCDTVPSNIYTAHAGKMDIAIKIDGKDSDVRQTDIAKQAQFGIDDKEEKCSKSYDKEGNYALGPQDCIEVNQVGNTELQEQVETNELNIKGENISEDYDDCNEDSIIEVGVEIMEENCKSENTTSSVLQVPTGNVNDDDKENEVNKEKLDERDLENASITVDGQQEDYGKDTLELVNEDETMESQTSKDNDYDKCISQQVEESKLMDEQQFVQEVTSEGEKDENINVEIEASENEVIVNEAMIQEDADATSNEMEGHVKDDTDKDTKVETTMEYDQIESTVQEENINVEIGGNENEDEDDAATGGSETEKGEDLDTVAEVMVEEEVSQGVTGLNDTEKYEDIDTVIEEEVNDGVAEGSDTEKCEDLDTVTEIMVEEEVNDDVAEESGTEKYEDIDTVIEEEVSDGVAEESGTEEYEDIDTVIEEEVNEGDAEVSETEKYEDLDTVIEGAIEEEVNEGVAEDSVAEKWENIVTVTEGMAEEEVSDDDGSNEIVDEDSETKATVETFVTIEPGHIKSSVEDEDITVEIEGSDEEKCEDVDGTSNKALDHVKIVDGDSCHTVEHDEIEDDNSENEDIDVMLKEFKDTPNTSKPILSQGVVIIDDNIQVTRSSIGNKRSNEDGNEISNIEVGVKKDGQKDRLTTFRPNLNFGSWKYNKLKNMMLLGILRPSGVIPINNQSSWHMKDIPETNSGISPCKKRKESSTTNEQKVITGKCKSLENATKSMSAKDEVVKSSAHVENREKVENVSRIAKRPMHHELREEEKVPFTEKKRKLTHQVGIFKSKNVHSFNLPRIRRMTVKKEKSQVCPNSLKEAVFTNKTNSNVQRLPEDVVMQESSAKQPYLKKKQLSKTDKGKVEMKENNEKMIKTGYIPLAQVAGTHYAVASTDKYSIVNKTSATYKNDMLYGSRVNRVPVDRLLNQKKKLQLIGSTHSKKH